MFDRTDSIDKATQSLKERNMSQHLKKHSSKAEDRLSVIESRGFLLRPDGLNWIDLQTPNFLASDPPEGQAQFKASPAWMNSLSSEDLQIRMSVLDFSDGSQKVEIHAVKGDKHTRFEMPEPYRLTKENPEMLLLLEGTNDETETLWFGLTAIKAVRIVDQINLITRVFTIKTP